MNLSIPIFHALKLTAQKAQELNFKKLLLLGTQFTMEDVFFAKILEENNCIAHIPSVEDRNHIQAIQNKLSKGILATEFEEYFKSLLEKFNQMDAVILGCTELPLAISQSISPMPILNPIHLQCQAALKWYIEES